MASANRCPECKQTIHPMAALCGSCGADLDAWRRQRREAPQRGLRVQLPSLGNDHFDMFCVALVLILLALFSPLIGLLLGMFLFWHGHHYGPVWRRNIAAFAVALAIFDLFDPAALVPHIL